MPRSTYVEARAADDASATTAARPSCSRRWPTPNPANRDDQPRGAVARRSTPATCSSRLRSRASCRRRARRSTPACCWSPTRCAANDVPTARSLARRAPTAKPTAASSRRLLRPGTRPSGATRRRARRARRSPGDSLLGAVRRRAARAHPARSSRRPTRRRAVRATGDRQRRRPRNAAAAGAGRRLPRRRRPASARWRCSRAMGTGARRGSTADRAGQAAAWRSTTRPQAFAELLLGLAVDLNRLRQPRAAADAGPGRALRRPRQQRRPRCCWPCCSNASDRADRSAAALDSVSDRRPVRAQARRRRARASAADRSAVPRRCARAQRRRGRRAPAPATSPGSATSCDDLEPLCRGRRRLRPRRRARRAAQGRQPLDAAPAARDAQLEAADRWPEAKRQLQAGAGDRARAAAAPQLSRLWQARAGRGSRRGRGDDPQGAARSRPDDASITDSLGWALYKRGRLPEAIETLQRAAAARPAAGRNPRASRRRAVHAGPPLRGALRVAARRWSPPRTMSRRGSRPSSKPG